jgi:glucose-6-phosphate isomerase
LLPGLIMKDAGIEAKPVVPPLTAHLGEYEAAVQATLREAADAKVIGRIWAKDASLWKSEESHQKIIANSLGWLSLPKMMLDVSHELVKFAENVRGADERQAMVCGMGGSSLCPEVLRRTFGSQEGFPELLVLDSTDPDVIDNFAKQIDITRCLFIIASKSGTTTEPVAFHRYWFSEVEKNSQNLATPGSSFVAITDPGTLMAETAVGEEFRRIFLNPSDIGGRYSALSYFGMVPAALLGLDIKELLVRAHRMSLMCGPGVNVNENPAALLGAVMSESARAGRDKLTILTDQKLSALGLWIEQLVAESTGKEGKGIVPVIGEPLGPPSAYGDDRLFVSIMSSEVDEGTASKLEVLEAAGHPVVYRNLGELNELGAEFFLWEMATAFAGWRMGINPFDQPNVQESKDMTKALLERFAKEGKLDEPSPSATDGTLSVYSNDRNAPASVTEVLEHHLAKVKPRDYIALLAYVEETPEIDLALQALRVSLRKATGCATTTGYGPRFLHSTGQLHKGGPDSGVFIQLTAPDKIDFEVPGSPYTFSILKQAQAQGDLEALLAHGRRAIRVDLGANVLQGLTALKELLAKGA